MHTKALWAALIALLVGLSGCTGGDGDDHDDHDHDDECPEGQEPVEQHVMNEDGSHSTVTECAEPGPPAVLKIVGLPATLQVYSTATFQWVLETTLEEDHAMRTEVRVDSASVEVTNRTQADDYGASVALQEHQNFGNGTSYTATFTPEAPGTYYFRAFALVQQTNVWSDEYTLQVTDVQLTGTTHTVTLDNGCLPGVGSIEPADLAITLGDEVAWTSGDPDSYAISGTGPASFATTSGGAAIMLPLPGSYTYTATGTLGECSGTIGVTPP